MSFGVSSSAPGQPFDYERVFADADMALYEAKSLGRNRVCAAEPVRRQSSSPTATAQAPRPAASAAG